MQESVAVVGEQPVPHAISVKWNLLYLPIMAVTFAGGATARTCPTRSPCMDFDGTNRHADKTPLVLWMPVLIQAFMGLCSHSPTGPSRVRRNGPNPVLRPRRRWRTACSPARIYLVVGGVVIAIAMIAMPLSFMNLINPGRRPSSS